MVTAEVTEFPTAPMPDATRRGALWIAETATGGILFIVLLQALIGFNITEGRLWEIYWPAFVQGIWGSLGYVVVILPLSLAAGFSLGLARISRFRLFSWPASVYVDFFRGVPPLVIVIFAFLIGPSLVPQRFQGRLLGLGFASIALSLHSAAFQAEIFRAGFQSVPQGQIEAAQALGLTAWKAMARVVLPQALRLSLPPLGNEFAVVIKDTSLLAAIGAIDLFGVSLDVQQNLLFTVGYDPRWFIIVWTAVAVVYFVMTTAMTRVFLFLERRFHVRGIEAISL